jgi:dCMP deaminase
MGWFGYFKKIMDAVKTKSKDRSVQVPCLIVDDDHSIVSTGYNGFPRGVNDNIDARHERPIKYRYTEHAERNAIYNAARRLLKGKTLLIAAMPCTDCMRGIIQSGIAKVVVYSPYVNERWYDDALISYQMAIEAGVILVNDKDEPLMEIYREG